MIGQCVLRLRAVYEAPLLTMNTWNEAPPTLTTLRFVNPVSSTPQMCQLAHAKALQHTHALNNEAGTKRAPNLTRYAGTGLPNWMRVMRPHCNPEGHSAHR